MKTTVIGFQSQSDIRYVVRKGHRNRTVSQVSLLILFA
jgi:hypothetical protein